MPTVIVNSNVRVITTGNAPTTTTLPENHLAFGKLTSDGKYHIFGNSDGTVVDLVLSSFPVNVVQGKGTSTTDVMSQNAVTLIVNAIEATLANIWDDTEENLVDNGFAVLSSDPDRVYTSADIVQMLAHLNVYNKTEVDALIAGVYKIKGSINSYADLLATVGNTYDPEPGDVWNIQTAGGTDSSGDPINAGDSVVYTGVGWEVMGGMVDLTNYYTKSEVNSLLPTKLSDLVNDIDPNDVLDGEAYTTAEQTKVGYLDGTGDGTKVLTDDGTYDSLTVQLGIVQI